MYMNANTMLEVDTASLNRQDLIDIYEQHSPGIYRYAVRLLGDPIVAEDCVSETFSRFLGAVRRGGGPIENVRAYLYRVAHNWITDYFRREPLPELPLDVKEHVEPGSNPDKLVSEALERDRVRAALLRLPPEQQQIIQLRFLENWSHEEVALVLGKTIDATRSMQYRAIVSLRRMLTDEPQKDDHER
jgi:RNA polymerase sigma-70 factor (ECF subfamily)